MDALRSLVFGRWLMLLAIVPYAVVLSPLEGAGGGLGVFALSAAVLYLFASLDARSVAASGAVRFALRRGRAGEERVLLDHAKVIFGVVAVIGGVLLLFASLWAGVALLVVLGLLALFDVASRRLTVSAMELDLPALTIVLPLAVVGLVSPGVPAGASVLCFAGAVLLGGYCLVCLIRDEQFDRGEGRRTAATVLGPVGASVLLFVFAGVGVMLSLSLTGPGGLAGAVLPWPIAGVLALGSMATLWLVALGAASMAAALWLGTIVVFAVSAAAAIG